jgi:hypothetical protein
MLGRVDPSAQSAFVPNIVRKREFRFQWESQRPLESGSVPGESSGLDPDPGSSRARDGIACLPGKATRLSSQFIDSDRFTQVVDELRSYGEKSPKTPWIWIVVDDFVDSSLASPDRYPWHLTIAFELLKEAGVDVAPGVDFGQMGRKRSGSASPARRRTSGRSPRRWGSGLGGGSKARFRCYPTPGLPPRSQGRLGRNAGRGQRQGGAEGGAIAARDSGGRTFSCCIERRREEGWPAIADPRRGLRAGVHPRISVFRSERVGVRKS